MKCAFCSEGKVLKKENRWFKGEPICERCWWRRHKSREPHRAKWLGLVQSEILKEQRKK